MENKFEIVAKTFQGLEDVLAEEIKALGGENIAIGRRMVSFEGDKAMLYRANYSCRTALRILKPIYKFVATDPDGLYEMTKEFDWTTGMTVYSTFSIDIVVNSCFSCILLCGHHLNDIASLHIILETEYEIIDASNAEYSEKGELTTRKKNSSRNENGRASEHPDAKFHPSQQVAHIVVIEVL